METHGIEGLKDLPPVHKNHPGRGAGEDRCLEFLSLSVVIYRVSDQLKLEGISVSAPTIQNILNKEGLGTRYERAGAS